MAYYLFINKLDILCSGKACYCIFYSIWLNLKANLFVLFGKYSQINTCIYVIGAELRPVSWISPWISEVSNVDRRRYRMTNCRIGPHRITSDRI